MTKYQRLVISSAAVLVALRLLFPVRYGYYGRVDSLTTLLHVLAILALTAAVVVLAPALDLQGLRSVTRRLRPVLLVAAWLGYVIAAAAGIDHYGLTLAMDEILFLPTTIALVGFLLLLELTLSR